MPSIPKAARKRLGLDDGSVNKIGSKGHTLYESLGPLRLYFLALVMYTLSAYGALAWALSGQSLPGQRHVLPTGDIKVNQFYAGLALSAILAPAAFVVRLTGAEIQSLHPFALAARTAVKISDLDRIMDPGPYAIRTMLKYSKWFAAVQCCLMISASLLVPVGTLILTVDNYSPTNSRHAVTGLPATEGGTPVILSVAMGATVGPEEGRFGASDAFLHILITIVKGIVVSLPTTLFATPGHLGPTASLNITYEQSVRYNGLITYNWSGGCEPADDEVQFDFVNNSTNVTITFPDGSQNTTDFSYQATTLLWSNATGFTDSGVPLEGPTYVVQIGSEQWVSQPFGRDNVDYTNGKDGLIHTGGAWITRVKCNPFLSWEVSSCVWNGTVMESCISTPGQNTTELDTTALNLLPGYMSAVSWTLYQKLEAEFIHAYQISAFTTLDIDVAYGTVALAIAQFTTTGYFGRATVPTTGQRPTPVYIVRIPVLVGIALLFTLVVSMIAADIQLTSWRQLPVRKTSFLTIATAVRGSWWDDELYGRCTLGRTVLRRRTTAKVKFGVDPLNRQNIGLAPIVLPIQKDAVYHGISTAVASSFDSSVSKLPNETDDS